MGNSLKLRRMKHITLWFSLALSFWLVIGGIEGTILCFGSEGHLQLEFVEDAGCYQLPEMSASSFPENPMISSLSLPSAEDNCGPCTDIVLSIADVARYSASYPTPLLVSQHQLPPTGLLAASTAVCAEAPGTISVPEQWPTPSGQTLAILSSAVLLI